MAKLNFFTCTRRPYYIVSGDFENKFAGIRALHYLCHMLNQLGAEAYLLGCQKVNTKLNTPLLQTADVLRHHSLELTPIVVYPETVRGNPFAAANVVRWLLNKPAHLGGDKAFADTEMLFAFSADFIPAGMEIPLLRVPVVDSSVFHNRDNPNDGQRQVVCYYANKYLAKGGRLTEHAEGARSLCQDVKLTQTQLADILRQSELLLCYEPSSIVAEALLCGCPVAMVPTPYLQGTEQDFQGPGIAFGTETSALAEAKATVSKATADYQRLEQECIDHVKWFLQASRAGFSNSQDLSDDWVGAVLERIQPTPLVQRPLSLEFNRLSKKWLLQHELNEARVGIMAERLASNWQTQPGFHLIMLVNSHELQQLARTLSSMQEQLYTAWGLTILSDSPAPDVFKDTPANIEWLEVEAGINESIEAAVEAAGLDWIMQLVPGDTLAPHALLSFAETINYQAGKHFIYCDEELDNTVQFKPDFSLDYLRAWSYLGRGLMISREAFEAVGGYTRFAYVYATDLAFKVFEQYGGSAFAHIPDVLCTSVTVENNNSTLTENEWLIRHGHFKRLNLPVTISHPEHKNRFQTQFKPRAHSLVSILIAHRNQATHLSLCLDEIVANTDYPNFEIVVVDVNSEIEDLQEIYAAQQQRMQDRFRVIYINDDSYAAAINAAAAEASGDYLVLLSCYVRTINSNWLSELLPQAQREDVAVVGCRVISDENKIVHAGGILGTTDDVQGLYIGRDISEPGYMERAHCIQEYSSVSSACLIVSKAHFQEAGGLATDSLATSKYLITDFCLKQKATHGRILWTPYATVYQDIKHAELSNGISDYSDESLAILKKWHRAFAHDPFYNFNLGLAQQQSLPETQLVCRWDTRIKDKPRILALPLNSSGAGQYRVKAPLTALEEAGLVQLTWLPNHELMEQPRLPSLFELNRLQPDVLYVQQALSDTLHTFLSEVRSHTNIKIIFSLDDLVTDLPPSNDRHRLVFRDMRYRLRRTLALCHRVIVTTEPLAALCQQYCDDVVVIPNRLEAKRWLSVVTETRNVGAKPRVGWAGAWQHQGDLSMMTELVKALADRVDWVFMGMCPADARPYIREFHEFVRFDDYPQKLAELNLDLALAPLDIHPFNEAKSNLRLLEYGILGWPVIATDIYPYQQFDAPVTLLANDVEMWEQHIVAALDKPEIIAARGRQLADWVRQKFILEDHLDDWLHALNI